MRLIIHCRKEVPTLCMSWRITFSLVFWFIRSYCTTLYYKNYSSVQKQLFSIHSLQKYIPCLMHTTLKYNIFSSDYCSYFFWKTHSHTMILHNSTSWWWKNEMGANILFKNLIAFICIFILCLLAKLLHSPENLCVCLQNVKVLQKNAKFLWGTQ